MAQYKKGDRISVDLGKTGQAKHWVDSLGNKVSSSAFGAKKVEATFKYPIYEWNGENWVSANEFSDTKLGKNASEQTVGHYKDVSAVEAASATAEELGSGEWGAANIGKDDFVDPATGKPRSLIDVAKILDPKLPNITGEELINQIKDMFPKYAGVPAEEKEFAREGFKKDVYGISKAAGEAGAQARGAYGSGMGAGMRGAYGGMKDISQQFKFAEQGYKQDIYGLEKAAAGKFEGEIAGALEADWFETPAGGAKQITEDWEAFLPDEEDEGGISGEGQGDYREGGRVPNKEGTFLNFLIQLPDAGGS